MIENYTEAFEKTRTAGTVAAGALDEVSKIIRPGIQTDEIDKICYEFISDHKLTLRHYFIEDFLNLVVHQLITLCVMEYLLRKF